MLLIRGGNDFFLNSIYSHQVYFWVPLVRIWSGRLFFSFSYCAAMWTPLSLSVCLFPSPSFSLFLSRFQYQLSEELGWLSVKSYDGHTVLVIKYLRETNKSMYHHATSGILCKTPYCWLYIYFFTFLYIPRRAGPTYLGALNVKGRKK